MLLLLNSLRVKDHGWRKEGTSWASNLKVPIVLDAA